MEEDKIQKLHDSLSKLRRGTGLGTSSHYNFGSNVNNSDIGGGLVKLKEGEDGKMHRDDGLPVNALYSNFVKQGSYSKKDTALKYGDGRAIKRNFDDCSLEDGDDGGSTSSSSPSPDKKKRKKEKKKKEKELKKAEKLEAKRKAKLEEKKRLKLEEKKLAKLQVKKKTEKEKKESDESAKKKQ